MVGQIYGRSDYGRPTKQRWAVYLCWGPVSSREPFYPVLVRSGRGVGARRRLARVARGISLQTP